MRTRCLRRSCWVGGGGGGGLAGDEGWVWPVLVSGLVLVQFSV